MIKESNFIVVALSYFLSPLLCLTRLCSVCVHSPRAQCRPEVMGSRRKVRSRVHGGVKEPRARLLFAPLHLRLPSSFLQEDVSSVPQRPHLATRPQTRTTCLFFCVHETFPDRTQQHHHVNRGRQFSAFHPTSAPAQFFCLQPP